MEIIFNFARYPSDRAITSSNCKNHVCTVFALYLCANTWYVYNKNKIQTNKRRLFTIQRILREVLENHNMSFLGLVVVVSARFQHCYHFQIYLIWYVLHFYTVHYFFERFPVCCTGFRNLMILLGIVYQLTTLSHFFSVCYLLLPNTLLLKYLLLHKFVKLIKSTYKTCLLIWR